MTINMNMDKGFDSLTFRYFYKFLSKSGRTPKNNRGVYSDDLSLVEELFRWNNFIYNLFGIYVGELYSRNSGRFEKTVKLLRFYNQVIHTNDIDSSFKCFDALAKIDFSTGRTVNCKGEKR